VCAGQYTRAAFLRQQVERPRLSDMVEDFSVLAAELERCFGGTGVMPTRVQLRAIQRSDLEKAITAHGGSAAVSKKMGWRLAYPVHIMLVWHFCKDLVASSEEVGPWLLRCPISFRSHGSLGKLSESSNFWANLCCASMCDSTTV